MVKKNNAMDVHSVVDIQLQRPKSLNDLADESLKSDI
jgi:hypothetical protein